MHGIIAGVATVVGAAVLATSTFGYWAGNGTGAAASRLDSTQELLLEPAVASAYLRPGASGSVAVRVENRNPFEVRLQTLELDAGAGTGGFDVDAAHAGCDVSALSFTNADNGGGGWTIPPRVGSSNGARDIHLDDAITMDIDAVDACQGAHFDVHVQVGG
ncbi:MAG: hypothetical protein JWM90_3101 [Thermoleophilia bacterium]|nr:hypothetical protein [Thermoleophilia bacterium]